jgi:hypothetical protein
MIRKKNWIDENCFYNPFEHIWLKIVFDPEHYGFWKCGFNKNCSHICDKKAWMHNIYDIKPIFNQNIFISKI